MGSMEKVQGNFERFSNKVTKISFILSLLVIAIHANNLKYYGLQNSGGI